MLHLPELFCCALRSYAAQLWPTLTHTTKLHCTLVSYAASFWSTLNPSNLRWTGTLKSYAALFWAELHTSELPHTLRAICTVLSFTKPYWTKLHPIELPLTLLSYALPYWTTLHHPELSYAVPFWASMHPLSYAVCYWAWLDPTEQRCIRWKKNYAAYSELRCMSTFWATIPCNLPLHNFFRMLECRTVRYPVSTVLERNADAGTSPVQGQGDPVRYRNVPVSESHKG
jgi:hypothetical protein